MTTTLTRVLPFSKQLLHLAITAGDTVIDATVGNGHDTLFLAECVGDLGHVFGFDVQEAAINKTQTKLNESAIKNVSLILDGHQNVLNYVDHEISAAIFNLGYLPGSDQTITTQGTTTWKAVLDILQLLKKNGLIILVVYHGHEEGKIERHFIEEHINSLDSKATQVLRYQFPNRPTSPYILAIEKL